MVAIVALVVAMGGVIFSAPAYLQPAAAQEADVEVERNNEIEDEPESGLPEQGEGLTEAQREAIAARLEAVADRLEEQGGTEEEAASTDDINAQAFESRATNVAVDPNVDLSSIF